ncbi:MAG: hypothetical protein AAF604_06295 [Acidobacteriota bacterium]
MELLRRLVAVLFVLGLAIVAGAEEASAVEPPDTGISGVYEVMVGAEDAAIYERYFAEFGFRVVARGKLSADEAEALYGVPSALKSVRMQNGDIASHGLVRILEWAEPLGPGVGYAPPETLGMRMAVMRTTDIFRLVDTYRAARKAGERWLPIEPVYDDLYSLTEGDPSFFNRPVGVRETAVYGELFHHVFFQRYGYQIPGYGTIGDHSPLATSEFTHHDFIVDGEDLGEMTNYYRDALGFRDEGGVVLDGDWQDGPQRVFDMAPGTSHWYRGFVSPNNICGKLKFFLPTGPKPDRTARQRPGELGITLHSLYTPKLEKVRHLLIDQGIQPGEIRNNEFGERGFVFIGPDGAAWQILDKTDPEPGPVTEFELVKTGG